MLVLGDHQINTTYKLITAMKYPTLMIIVRFKNVNKYEFAVKIRPNKLSEIKYAYVTVQLVKFRSYFSYVNIFPQN